MLLGKKGKCMRVPPISKCGAFAVQRNAHFLKHGQQMSCPTVKSVTKDTVTFSSKSKYLKQYASLPYEIREKLSPSDGIDMFQNMELIANGLTKGNKLAENKYVDVYENPWLNGYYFMISTNIDDDTRVIYSQTNMGDLVWEDPKDKRMQMLKKVS